MILCKEITIMSSTHLHLLLNHVPIIGSIFGGFVLAYGIWSKSHQTIIASYYLLIISSLGGVITYLTGESAEETVEGIQGISMELVERHEDLAVFSVISVAALGILALAGLIVTLKKLPLAHTMAWAALLVSLVSFGSLTYTGYTGGQVRHTEIHRPFAGEL